MSNDKQIKISAVLDSSTFDKGMKEIQDKMKKLTDQQAQGAGAQKALGKDTVMGKYAQAAFGDFNKDTQRQLEQMYQVQRREAVNQQITLKGKEAEMAKMAKADADMTKQQKERLDLLKKEIEILKEKHRFTLNSAAEAKKALDKISPAAPAGAPPGSSGGFNPQQEPQNQFQDSLKKMMMVAGGAALVKGAFNAGITIADDLITRDRKINTNNAASMNIASKEMREQFQGQGSRGMFWMPERARAMRSAAGEQRSMAGLDVAKAGGSVAAGLGGAWAGLLAGGVAGAYGGAAIGTAFGGIGALPGSVIGAGLGAAGGAIGGGLAGFYGTSSEKTRARMFDQEKYRSMMTKEGLEKYEQNLAAEKAKDPRKQMAREYFEENRGNIANLQKQMGVGSDAELMGGGGVGLLQRNMKYGGQYGGVNFNQETIEQQVQALASGGAMTSGIRDLSGAAATYNRQFNVNNAGSTMGRLQGNTGMNSSMTDMAYQRILTEAVRMGVDTSSMPRELERMTQMTAELQTAGGVNAEGMGELFSSGLAGFNQKSISAAGSAAETFKATGKEAGGWEGQMGMGFLQGGAAQELMGGKQLSARDMNYINQMSYAEMDEAGFQRVGEYLGIDASKAKELLKQKDMYKQSRTSSESSAYEALGGAMKAKGPMTPDQLKEFTSSGEGGRLFTEAEAERTRSQGGFMQKDVATRQAEILQQAGMAAGTDIGTTLDMASGKVAGQKGKREDRAAFVEEGAEATGNMARMDALNEQIDSLKKAARNHTAYAEEYNTQFKALVDATAKGANAMDAVANQLTELERRMNDGSAGGFIHSSGPPGSR